MRAQQQGVSRAASCSETLYLKHNTRDPHPSATHRAGEHPGGACRGCGLRADRKPVCRVPCLPLLPWFKVSPYRMPASNMEAVRNVLWNTTQRDTSDTTAPGSTAYVERALPFCVQRTNGGHTGFIWFAARTPSMVNRTNRTK